MRWKYYKLTLRQMRFKKPFVFFLILVFFVIMLTSLFINRIQPTLISLCNSHIKSIALKSTNKAVYNYIKDVKYDNLINIEKDSRNRVTSLSANVMEMNRISTLVAKQVQDELSNHIESEILLPLGSIIGSNLLGGYGPKISIKILPVGEVEAKFKSSFESAGINQTRHSIIIEVCSYVRTISPIYSDTQKYINDIVVAETVIVGDIPEAYYDIQGIEGLSQKDALELIE
ncbi:MAG: sporulation protein YunB [Clostridia bacterium]|nr:sporulation protein YunB [Clostridia bacterium]